MRLKHLIQSLSDLKIRGTREIDISGLSIDSRTTAPGHLFIAKKGSVHDGSQFIEQALQGGAIAIATDLYDPFLPCTQLIHPEPAALVAPLAARFYDDPSKDLFVLGVTGTKGKTTTVYLAQQLLNALKKTSGLISTVETIVVDHRFSSTLTTHDAIFNQKWLREMVKRGCKAACLEVSSHGLVQNRVAEMSFDTALFTNLSSDHLDYHLTMEAYAEAKGLLFELLNQSPKKNKRALLNGDSPWASLMKKNIKTPLWTFGIDQSVDIQGSNFVVSPKGMNFSVCFQGEKVSFTSQLSGNFNLYNLLGAIALGLHLGFSLKELQHPVSQLEGAPGRLQRVGEQIFVDYAHTGESLSQALSTLKNKGPRKLWVVFGCGGDRDPNRRIQMAEAAELYADKIVVTTDNCRSESAEEICRQIMSGFKNPSQVYIELDRREAIVRAVSSLEEGDLLLVAGKGHEKVQIFAHKTVPFDDVAVVHEALASLRD